MHDEPNIRGKMDILPYTIAVDFDGTIVADMFPEIGAPNVYVVDLLQQAKRKGIKLILWTCRDGEALRDAVAYCWDKHEITFDAINQSIVEARDLFNNDTRKAYADEYWDDKAYHKERVVFDKDFYNRAIERIFEHGI